VEIPTETESDEERGAEAARAAPAAARRGMPGLEQRLLARARAAGLRRGDRVVIGFSGGRDSLALAAALRSLGASLGLEPILVHVDHGLRPASAAEAEQAVALATALGLKCRVVPLLRAPSDVHRGVGLEEAARRERYRILLATARERNAVAVATAHHQRDQAETVLLHLLRGGGVRGAAGMAERTAAPRWPGDSQSDISPESSEVILWRPLLHESREAIEAYAIGLHLVHVDDPSNDDLTLRRNVIRHEVLPLLERQFPGATAALARFAALAAEDDRVLDEIAAREVATALRADGALEVAGLREAPIALRRRAIRLWLRGAIGESELSANRTDAVIDLVTAGRGKRTIEIGGGWTVHRLRGMLHVARGDGERGRDVSSPAGRGRGGRGRMIESEPRATGVARVLIEDEAIQRRTREIARLLDEEYGDEMPLLVGVLNGAVAFMTDLIRGMTIPLEIDFMAVSSYGAATQSSGVVRILKDLDQEIEGRRVVVVEDIVDSGLTLQYLLDVLQRRNPRDIRVVALLKKEKPEAVEVQVDHIGFTIPDEFVVGYGLDYAGKYRNLPYVAVLDPGVYTPE
jgi:hypoxanthine phosphoribosyltransferase